MDPAVAPGLILPRQPQHHRPHLAMRRRPPGPAPARHAPPPAADDVAVPAHDRAGSDDQPHRRQALSRHRPRQQCQPRPVRPGQTRMGARPLALCRSELVAQHEDIGVLPPPLPARQPKQRHDTGDDQEDQLQPHKPKIIPRPRSPRGAEQPATSGASGQVAQVFGTDNCGSSSTSAMSTGPIGLSGLPHPCARYPSRLSIVSVSRSWMSADGTGSEAPSGGLPVS